MNFKFVVFKNNLSKKLFKRYICNSSNCERNSNFTPENNCVIHFDELYSFQFLFKSKEKAKKNLYNSPLIQILFLENFNLKQIKIPFRTDFLIKIITQQTTSTSTGASASLASATKINGVQLMSPISPMLAEACKSVQKAIAKNPEGMFSEIKYDGERVQIHKSGTDFKWVFYLCLWRMSDWLTIFYSVLFNRFFSPWFSGFSHVIWKPSWAIR